MMQPLFATLTDTPWPMIGVASLAAFFGAKFLFKKDEQIEDRRAGAFDLSQDAAREGLDFAVPVLRAYSVGDYSGLLHELKSLASRLRDEDTRKAAFDKLVKVQVAKRMRDPERRDLLLKQIEELKAQEAVGNNSEKK